jgi:heme/copper-type cytochrome/quinol oxidase subunit 3
VAVAAFRALGGQFTPTQHDAVTAAAIYWYVMVGVFSVIWLAISIHK